MYNSRQKGKTTTNVTIQLQDSKRTPPEHNIATDCSFRRAPLKPIIASAASDSDNSYRRKPTLQRVATVENLKPAITSSYRETKRTATKIPLKPTVIDNRRAPTTSTIERRRASRKPSITYSHATSSKFIQHDPRRATIPDPRRPIFDFKLPKYFTPNKKKKQRASGVVSANPENVVRACDGYHGEGVPRPRGSKPR